jgi:hypothetical protein
VKIIIKKSSKGVKKKKGKHGGAKRDKMSRLSYQSFFVSRLALLLFLCLLYPRNFCDLIFFAVPPTTSKSTLPHRYIVPSYSQAFSASAQKQTAPCRRSPTLALTKLWFGDECLCMQFFVAKNIAKQPHYTVNCFLSLPPVAGEEAETERGTREGNVYFRRSEQEESVGNLLAHGKRKTQ